TAFIPSAGRGGDCPLLPGDRRGRQPVLCGLFLLAGGTGRRGFKGERLCSGAAGADIWDRRRTAGGFKRKEATIGEGPGQTGCYFERFCGRTPVLPNHL